MFKNSEHRVLTKNQWTIIFILVLILSKMIYPTLGFSLLCGCALRRHFLHVSGGKNISVYFLYWRKHRIPSYIYICIHFTYQPQFIILFLAFSFEALEISWYLFLYILAKPSARDLERLALILRWCCWLCTCAIEHLLIITTNSTNLGLVLQCLTRVFVAIPKTLHYHVANKLF